MLREDGSPIPELYAAVPTTASVMWHTYPGPGFRLGPATTFAFIGMRHLSGLARKERQPEEAPAGAIVVSG